MIIDMLQALPPAVALILSLFLLVWLVLLFLVPFMVESIRGWTRKVHAELEEMNRKLDRLNALLGERGTGLAPVRLADPVDERVDRIDRPAPAAGRARREPTISELPPIVEPPWRPPDASRAGRRP
ncbi:MAG TPA: hypothetical protein VF322_09260 [Gammaproteobacteria bacterium]